jgi:hypothetical protein
MTDAVLRAGTGVASPLNRRWTMEQLNENDARQILRSDDEVVVEPWEERVEVVEAGLDDTTAPVAGTAADNGRTPNGETAS